MPIIGLDLGKRRFRAVEIAKEKGVYVLNNYGEHDSSDLSLNFSSPEALAHYAEVLRLFVKEHNFSTSHAVVAIPERDVFTRVIETPVMNQKDLHSFIELGAEEYIPATLSEVTYDLQIIESPEKGSTKENMTVLLVASKNAVLNQYVQFLKQAGFTPRGMEPETLAIERILGDSEERPSAAIIVNIGLLSTEIIITYKGYVRFTRSLPIGGDELTKVVQKSLNLDAIQAEEYKKAYGLDESQVEGKVFNAIKPVFDNILLEINRSKTYYTSRNPDVIINRVILSGGTALMPGMLLYIANKLDVEVELANPWRNIRISDRIKNKREELLETSPIFSTAVGLALKEI
jgi:type IV pilus assembly protein PilM